MQIMSQDECRLVNSDYVSQFYIEETLKGARLMAESDTCVIQLGTYDNVDHAKKALEFIGICMVDPDDQNKITQVPTQEDMTNSLKLPKLSKILANALSSKGESDSKLDIESMLKDILK